MVREFDAVIVGMGPAGMAAAAELAKMGVPTAIVDENPDPGGQIYRRPAREFTITDPGVAGLGHTRGRRLIEDFSSCKNRLTVINGAYIWGVFKGQGLAVTRNGKTVLIAFKKLLLAEGAMERSIPFPGWTLPGIMMLGGLQRLILHERLLPGKTFLLAGNSPLLLSVAAGILRAGGEIVSLCYPGPMRHYMRLLPALMGKPSLALEVLACYIRTLKDRVRTLSPYAVVSATGGDRVEAVTAARLDENWRPVTSSEKSFQVDTVGVSYGFVPSGRVARLCGCDHIYDQTQMQWKPRVDRFMQTGKSGIYVAGDSAGIGGADMAEVEGRIAAVHMAAELGRLPAGKRDRRATGLIKKRKRLERYAQVLNSVFEPKTGLYGAIDEETIVCRCERVTAREILAGIESGYRNIDEIKRTRFGMGLCQGRVCESVVAQLMIRQGIPVEEIGFMNLRPPLSPMPLSQFEPADPAFY
jgi:NADPH-dependent 2,4-dienoyl-CoA reductase/sulfur reductase-like enzyme